MDALKEVQPEGRLSPLELNFHLVGCESIKEAQNGSQRFLGPVKTRCMIRGSGYLAIAAIENAPQRGHEHAVGDRAVARRLDQRQANAT